MNLEQRMARIVSDCEAANAAVRDGMDALSVADARWVAKTARLAEGWLVGIRRLLEVEA